jgi:endonuclease-8
VPEGPEIRRARDQLAAAIEGQTALKLRFHLPALLDWNRRFDGERVVRVQSRGKALLIHLSGGYSIYSHNQLYGRWVVVDAGELPDSSRQLRLAIQSKDKWALLYSASDIEVLTEEQVAVHRFLTKLGPDVLDAGTRPDQVYFRLLSDKFVRRQLGGFLTDQRFVAGLGNYLRCEILFACGLHPRQRPSDLDDARLMLLAEKILALPRQSYQTGGITNELARAKKLMASDHSFEQARFQVFRRGGENCYRCGSEITRINNGGQSCYLCPGCQQ